MFRADLSKKTYDLHPDLRMFEDYCLHANRTAFLWTWLRSNGSLDNVWDEFQTRGEILENQTREE